MIVCLDTNIVIYVVEGDPVWEPKVDQRLQEILAAGDTLAVCDAARLECLVGPLRNGDAGILADYQKFFVSPSIQMLAVTPAIWERAAQIRAAYRFQALDSIHLASAIENGCPLFWTNDVRLARCTAIKVEVLT